MKLNLKEVETDPDVVESAELLAIQFRSSLYENDALDEWIANYVSDQIDLASDKEDIIEENSEISVEEIYEAELAVLGIVAKLLKPMIEKILDEPQFQTNA